MDSTLACLEAWMPRQRWYASKGSAPALRLVARWDHADPHPDPRPRTGEDDVRVRTLLVADESARPATLYQVPVVSRPAAGADPAGAHVIGSPAPGAVLVDGPFDPAYTDALLRLVTTGGAWSSPDGAAGARGVPSAAAPAAGAYTASVLGGEQSNTSIVYRGEAVAPVICKVFRQLHPGLNPDIELQTALAEAGSPYIPRAVGSATGSWPDPSGADGAVEGSLAFAQEFLPGVEDAWRVALRAAVAAEDFTAPARDLGVATAEVHVSLARALGAAPARPEEREGVVAAWRRRLRIAIAEVPELAEAEQAIEAVYARAERDDWPALQRVHGDYHLGQVILAPDRGWVLLDFEGEPIRPMAERRRPDLAIRDVAGMLRSFDYVAGSVRLERPAEPAEAWARAARSSFLDGYAAASGVDLEAQRSVLDALELDKAVYEAIYEVRNRPGWLAIPLDAVRRLVG